MTSILWGPPRAVASVNVSSSSDKHTARSQRPSHSTACSSLGSSKPIDKHSSRVTSHTHASTLERPLNISTRPPVAHVQLDAPCSSRLVDNACSFVEQHRIRAYEVGPDQKTTIITIANLLQEVAGNNGVALWGRTEDGFATDPIMVALDLIFVSTRIQIQMDKYPRWGDLVEIETWFMAEGRIAACRNWLMRDANTREVLGRATSTWVMLNHKTRKLSKIPDGMRQKLEGFAPNPPKHSIDPARTRLKLPEVASPPTLVGPVQVARRSDMDMNGHINNVTYMAWTLETVPEEVYKNCQLYQVELDYKSECRAGDTIESLGSQLLDYAGAEAKADHHHSSANGNGSGSSNGSTPYSQNGHGNDNSKAGTETLAYMHTLRCCNGDDCRELVRARTLWKCKH